MKDIMNRALLPEEIEARIDSVSANSFTLVLYVTARAAMNLLDEAFGQEWSRRTSSPEKSADGTYYTVCSIEVKAGEQTTIVREDIGEGKSPKAAASDALKRATTNLFPSLRALYTVPTLRVKAEKLGIKLTADSKNKDARRKELNDAIKYKSFSVNSITFGQGATGEIVKALSIVDDETGDIVLEYTAKRATLTTNESDHLLELRAKMIEVGVTEEQIVAEYAPKFGVNSLEEIANTKNIRENVLKRLANTKKPAKKQAKSSSVNEQLKGEKKKEEEE